MALPVRGLNLVRSDDGGPTQSRTTEEALRDLVNEAIDKGDGDGNDYLDGVRDGLTLLIKARKPKGKPKE